ncbi:hypothetical protein [Streptomyces sp. NBC_00122]|uniref:hypothetical protein n=1 Tax=Streptomyces sp. NBC_00122 TaxID=2903623 RepID=UPI0032550120
MSPKSYNVDGLALGARSVTDLTSTHADSSSSTGRSSAWNVPRGQLSAPSPAIE